MSVDEEKFFAWLDGELSGAEAAEMKAAVAADPELARLAKQHLSLSQTLRIAFDEVASAPVPDRIKAAVVTPQTNVIEFERADRQTKKAFSPAALSAWIGMAAALALGLLLGALLRTSGSAQFEAERSGLYAAASLERALDTQLASLPTSGDVRIALTFRNRAGDICRSFTLRGSAGLACRDDGRWNVRSLVGAPDPQSGEYRMAAGPDPNLSALIDSLIAGEPLDEEQEKAARRRGWR